MPTVTRFSFCKRIFKIKQLSADLSTFYFFHIRIYHILYYYSCWNLQLFKDICNIDIKL